MALSERAPYLVNAKIQISAGTEIMLWLIEHMPRLVGRGDFQVCRTDGSARLSSARCSRSRVPKKR
jgi:hypothetical protein